ncbi:MAG: hypothetical protein H6739_07310 [Alphaproteobacteria bacterium]|nr:hypothetical protein [Alphaproteobacteria bacterium]
MSHRSTPWRALFGVAFALSCTGGASWKTAQDCEGIADTKVADECYSAVAKAVFKADEAAGEAMMLKISDPVVRDYTYMMVTRELYPSDAKYCALIQDPRIAARCRVINQRPHLHRELTGEGKTGKAEGPPAPAPRPEGDRPPPKGAKGPPKGAKGPPPTE